MSGDERTQSGEARCNTSGGLFNVGDVEVVQRYADCSVFRCPACGKTHDDRMAWGGPRERRMGYTLITPSNRPDQYGWIA